MVNVYLEHAMKDLLVDRIFEIIYNMFVKSSINMMLVFWTGQFFLVFCFVFRMQLRLHDDRMTVETKNLQFRNKE